MSTASQKSPSSPGKVVRLHRMNRGDWNGWRSVGLEPPPEGMAVLVLSVVQARKGLLWRRNVLQGEVVQARRRVDRAGRSYYDGAPGVPVAWRELPLWPKKKAIREEYAYLTGDKRALEAE